MTHAASHFSLQKISRADGRSAVAAAAYRAGDRYLDARRGRSCNYRGKTGVLTHELVGWRGPAEDLWNAAEAAERRGDACVAREIVVALPAELPLSALHRLVRGFTLHLRDTYGVALQANVHAPRFHNPDHAEIVHTLEGQPAALEHFLSLLADPKFTNRNFHAHILMSSRQVSGGEFGAKTRILDNLKTGAAEVKKLRAEWQKRVNSELKRAGVSDLVDLRSYADRAAAADLPEGMVAQPHVGPRLSAKDRASGEGKPVTRTGKQRAKTKVQNEALLVAWQQLRALERARAKEKAASIAAQREAERKRAAEREREAIRRAHTDQERADALSAASNLHVTDTANPLAQAIAAAMAGDPAPSHDPYFDDVIDPETFTMKEPPHPPTTWEGGKRKRSRAPSRERSRWE